MGSPVAILVFARAPEPGRTKRRLIPALGAMGAARLHERMIRKTVATAVDADVGPVQLWCTPSLAHSLFRSLKQEYGLGLRQQRGGDLGERMHHACMQTLKDFSGVLLVGSDCPLLEVTDFAAAARHLDDGCEAILVPAVDGGYVLIGLTCPAPELFGNMAWGSAEVLGVTRRRLRELKWVWHELPPRRDIDRPEDLSQLEDEWFQGLDDRCETRHCE